MVSCYHLISGILIVCLSHNAYASLRCMECTDMPKPYDCGVVTTCDDGSACFLEQFVTSGGVILYNQGCTSTQRCNADARRSALTSVVMSARSSTDVVTCSECCDTDNCNIQGCRVTVPDSTSRGPFCYTCEAQADGDTCRQVTECSVDEICSIDWRTTSHTPGYHTICTRKTECDVITALQGTHGSQQDHTCPHCCDVDFCNDECVHNQSVSITPINGQWSLWSNWSPCSVTCGQGARTRSRSCDQPTPQYGGQSCTGNGTETAACNGQTDCGVNGDWSPWSPWSPCSVTCGQGTASRVRTCNNPVPQNGGQLCHGNANDNRTCDTQTQCVTLENGGWSPWSPWSPCSVTCGQGTASRVRTCNNPVPQNGGQLCHGNANDNRTCDTQTQCVTLVDGAWSLWTAWSTCSVTCGQGTTTRQRSCNNPIPQNGGHQCHGNSTDNQTCDTQTQCVITDPVVDGQWSSWSQWTACSVTCGHGNISRWRQCNNPAPQNGGHHCHGKGTDHHGCKGIQHVCNITVDGQWSDWGSWSKCSHTCDYGTTERHRTCSNPAPSHGGQDCTHSGGNAAQLEICKEMSCPAPPPPGHWGQWGHWSDCSVTCGHEGTRTRTRQCVNPGGGDPCPGDDTSTSHCSLHNCPVEPCDPHYKYYSTLHCIKIVTTPANSSHARDVCHLDHARLLVIHTSQQENQAEHILKQHHLLHDGVWLGLFLQHGVWMLRGNGSLVNSQFTEPFSDTRPGACAIKEGNQWLPALCSDHYAFLCQKHGHT